MIWIGIGGLGFLLYYLYDLNQAFWGKPLLRGGFAAGCLLLLGASGALFAGARASYRGGAAGVLLLAGAALFFALLVYTLFFALPHNTYQGAQGSGSLCDTGMYALCRHPGVWWLAGGYFCLAGAFPAPVCWGAAACFTALDVLYIVLQDRVIFPRTIPGYTQYRRSTPFLFPTWGSIQKARGGRHEV